MLLQATYLLLRIVREFEWIENRDEVEEYVELQRMAIESRRGVKIALWPGRGGGEKEKKREGVKDGSG